MRYKISLMIFLLLEIFCDKIKDYNFFLCTQNLLNGQGLALGSQFICTVG